MPWWGILSAVVYFLGWIATFRIIWEMGDEVGDAGEFMVIIPWFVIWVPATIAGLLWRGFGWLFGFKR